MKTLPFKKPTHMFANSAGVLLLSHSKTHAGTYIMSFDAGESLPYESDYESLFNYFVFSPKHLLGKSSPYLYLSREEMKMFFDEKDIFLFLLFYGKAL